MEKECDNCYWEGYLTKFCYSEMTRPEENICPEHEFVCCECEGEIAKYKYKDKHYCKFCLMKEFEVEEYSVTHYTLNGEYLGDEDEIDDVIHNLDDSIEDID